MLNRDPVICKPDYDLWRHTPIVHIGQAACIFTDIGWIRGGPDAYPEKAKDWAHAIATAMETGRIRNMSVIFDADHHSDTKFILPVGYETKVAIDDLRVWAKDEGIPVPFFSISRTSAHPCPFLRATIV